MSYKNIEDIIFPKLVTAEQDGSYLFAVAGLEEVLKGKNLIKALKTKRAFKLPQEIAKRSEAFLTDPKFEKIDLNLPQTSIDEISGWLFEDVGPDWLASKIEGLPDFNSEEILITLTRAITYLRERMPKIPVVRGRKLPDFYSSEFMRIYRTVSDPMTVLSDLEQGCLCRAQAQTLKDVFPSLYDVLVLSMTAAAAGMLAKDENFTVPWEKFKQLTVLNLSETVPKDLKALLQANFEGQGEDQTQGPNINRPMKIDERNASQQQRLESR